MKINRLLLDPTAPPGGNGTPPPAAPPAGPPPPADWMTTLPPDMQANPALATFKGKGVDEVVKSYLNAQQLIGAKRIALPGEKATPEERAEFFKAIGRPESFDKYSEGAIKPAEGLVIDQAGLKTAREAFFNLGLTDDQQKGVMDFYFKGMNEATGKITQNANQQKEQADAQLHQEWGQNYDTNMNIVNATLSKFMTEEARQELQGPLGNNLGLIKMLHSMGKAMLEDHSPSGASKLEVGTAAAAQARITQLKTDTNFQTALNDPQHIGHKEAVALWMDVHRQATPNNGPVAAS